MVQFLCKTMDHPEQTTAKQKPTRLKIADQAEPVGQLESGTTVSHLMPPVVFQSAQFSMLKKQRKNLAICNTSHNITALKSVRASMVPDIEKKLYNVTFVCHAHKVPVTCSVLQQRAMILCESYLAR